MKMVLVAAVVAASWSGMAQAGLIEKACLSSDRPGVSTALCGCIQKVANSTLSNSEQRLAAEFFSDPHRAQVIRQSDNASHEVFWQRYKAFGATAENHCG